MAQSSPAAPKLTYTTGKTPTVGSMTAPTSPLPWNCVISSTFFGLHISLTLSNEPLSEINAQVRLFLQRVTSLSFPKMPIKLTLFVGAPSPKSVLMGPGHRLGDRMKVERTGH